MKNLVTFLSISLFSVLMGCAALGTPPVDTFNKRLAAGYTTVTAVRSATLTAAQAGKVSVSDAKNLQSQADTAREGLVVAENLAGTDMTSANARLTVALTVLQGIQTYLNTRSTK